ncbi:germination protein GerD [Paenibacillus montaniterrae]|uniref:Germination protein GerD n=1 Tax=Paenibacillus montaniterrae TaxID=429341 RepID=A0A919YYP5_9BACL|nr:spore germination lipoprotein GerD [Paenibacillus montaniterrae]GIP19571.1 germination protein GerD [Paenibacillus montaniterrae]
MKRHLYVVSMLAVSILLLTSCAMGGGGGGGESSGMTYKDMKSMVIDILKTEDAQKALQESMSTQSGYTAQSSSMLNVQDQEQIRLAVKDVLLSPEYDKVLKSLMTDPKFAGEFSKAVNELNKDIHVELIKDPQYQEGLVEAFQSEDLNKVILKVIKGSEYRKELMSLMQDSLNNPIFRMQMFELMRKAIAEELAVKPQEQSGGSGEEKQQSSNESNSSDKESSSGESEKTS